MSRKKTHIDTLFREGLKDLSLFVSDRDFNAIDDKSSVFKDQANQSENSSSAFSDFELEISDNDWLTTKAKLENEKNLISSDHTLVDTFNDFAIEPDPQDWPITYDKYKKVKRRRVAFWWLSTGIVILLLGAAAWLMKDSKADLFAEKPSSTETIILHPETLNKISDDTLFHETNTAETPQVEEPGKNISQPNQTYANNAKTSKGKTQGEGDHNATILPRDPVSKPSKEKSSTLDPLNLTESYEINRSKIPALNIEGDTKKPQQQKDNFTLGETVKVSPVQPAAGKSSEQNADLVDSTKKGKKDLIGKDDKKPILPIKNPQLYLAMVNQIDYTYRLLSMRNNTIYNDIRNDADKVVLQYTGGIEFGVMAGKNQMSTGINYTAQTWNSQYQYSYKLFDSIPYYDTGRVLKGYFLFPKKDTSMNELRSVTLTKIQLPLSYNRLWQLNGHLRMSAGVSTILSYTVKAEGDKIISHDNRQLYYYSRLKNQEQLFNIAPAVSFGLQYQLSNQLMLAGNLGGNISMRSRFKPSFGVRDYPYSVGFNLKLIYLLK